MVVVSYLREKCQPVTFPKTTVSNASSTATAGFKMTGLQYAV
jgi:hypothetical protein